MDINETLEILYKISFDESKYKQVAYRTVKVILTKTCDVHYNI